MMCPGRVGPNIRASIRPDLPKASLDSRDLRSLLDGIPAVRSACGLDLLLFFYRHPRSLLTSEQLVDMVGHGRDRVVESLEALIEAGLLTRSPNANHAARLYVLQLADGGGRLMRLLKIGVTREGRSELLRLLAPASNGDPAAAAGRSAPILKIA